MAPRPLSVLIAALLPLFSSCGNPPYPRGSLDQLRVDGTPAVQAQMEVDGRTLNYVEVDGAGSPRIVFIHGSPGDWQAWAGYLRDPALRGMGPLIAPDRPGFGGSGAGQVVADLGRQAQLLAPLLEGRGGPAIVVGHSLGGAIALRLAVDFPDRVRGVLLIAASVAPELEAPRWYNELASWRPVQWLIPAELTWSNRELYVLQAQLRALDDDLPRLRAPVFVIQGMQDELVDPRSADYLERRLRGHPHRLWRIGDQGHFVLWKRSDEVTRILRQLVSETAPPEH